MSRRLGGCANLCLLVAHLVVAWRRKILAAIGRKVDSGRHSTGGSRDYRSGFMSRLATELTRVKPTMASIRRSWDWFGQAAGYA
jgi:hypothetical protein